MGYTHFEAARRLKGARVTAIATRDKKKLAGDWTSIQGNFGPRGGTVDLSKVKKYADYRELLADPNIDLVDLCLPTNLHASAVLESLAAGKPTLVEKPIAVDLKAADRMVAAARKANVPLMVAQVLPFHAEFQFVLKARETGKYGRLLAAHFRRVIAPPKWSQHIEDFRALGGWGIDLHIHDNHFIALLCGMPPESVRPRTGLRRLREPRPHPVCLFRSAIGGQRRQRRHRCRGPAVCPRLRGLFREGHGALFRRARSAARGRSNVR